MDEQIREQVELLYEHAHAGQLDLEFIAVHAQHLFQLAQFLGEGGDIPLCFPDPQAGQPRP